MPLSALSFQSFSFAGSYTPVIPHLDPSPVLGSLSGPWLQDPSVSCASITNEQSRGETKGEQDM